MDKNLAPSTLEAAQLLKELRAEVPFSKTVNDRVQYQTRECGQKRSHSNRIWNFLWVERFKDSYNVVGNIAESIKYDYNTNCFHCFGTDGSHLILSS